jgi:hypothetical protein
MSSSVTGVEPTQVPGREESSSRQRRSAWTAHGSQGPLRGPATSYTNAASAVAPHDSVGGATVVSWTW